MKPIFKELRTPEVIIERGMMLHHISDMFVNGCFVDMIVQITFAERLGEIMSNNEIHKVKYFRTFCNRVVMVTKNRVDTTSSFDIMLYTTRMSTKNLFSSIISMEEFQEKHKKDLDRYKYISDPNNTYCVDYDCEDDEDFSIDF